jgi:hypothetical protein
MRPSLLLTSLLAAALVSSGCHDISGPGGRSELQANRQKWTQSGVTDYTFTLRMDCFCAINGPVRVVVVADSARQVTMESTGEVLNAPWIPTIKKLFDFIDQQIARPAAVLQVTYDPTLGYPTRIVADPIANAVDDEVTYTVSNVTPTVQPHHSLVQGTAPAAPARRGSAPAVTRPFSILSAAP